MKWQSYYAILYLNRAYWGNFWNEVSPFREIVYYRLRQIYELHMHGSIRATGTWAEVHSKVNEYCDEWWLLEALLEVHKRWVDERVLLVLFFEGEPFIINFSLSFVLMNANSSRLWISLRFRITEGWYILEIVLF